MGTRPESPPETIMGAAHFPIQSQEEPSLPSQSSPTPVDSSLHLVPLVREHTNSIPYAKYCIYYIQYILYILHTLNPIFSMLNT